jgi:hypothetical protein
MPGRATARPGGVGRAVYGPSVPLQRFRCQLAGLEEPTNLTLPIVVRGSPRHKGTGRSSRNGNFRPWRAA